MNLNAKCTIINRAASMLLNISESSNAILDRPEIDEVMTKLDILKQELADEDAELFSLRATVAKGIGKNTISTKRLIGRLEKNKEGLFATPDKLEDAFVQYRGQEKIVATVAAIQGFNFGMHIAKLEVAKEVTKDKAKYKAKYKEVPKELAKS